jgi:GNAT superfamily N-acetyltransferase
MLTTTIWEFDPGGDPEHQYIKGVRSLMRNLQGYYELLKREESVVRIHEEINRLARTYSGKEGRIVIARTEGTPGTVLGLLCVRLNERGPADAELRFLWVDPGSRDFGLGEELIRQGLQTARSLGAAAAFVEILPELSEAIRLAARCGFVDAPDRKPLFSGRGVMELELK